MILSVIDDASKVIRDFLNYREQETGLMDTEFFKYDPVPEVLEWV